MTQEQVNHFLTLFIGGKWYLGEKIGEETYYLGVNRNFFTPNDFFHLKEWMEKNEPELWEKYIGHYHEKAYWIIMRRDDDRVENTAMIDMLNAIINPINLANFLIEEREEWEIEKCPDCHECVFERDMGEECSNCGGKTQHPAAKYLDSLEAKND